MRVSQYLWHSFVPDLFDRDGIAFDLGANHGEFSAYLSQNFRSVIAVEPNPAISAAGSIGNIETRQLAVGWPGAESDFNCSDVDVYSSLVSRTKGDQPGRESGNTFKVRVATLSELVRTSRAEVISFVKMDVEGAELDILLNEPAETLCRIKQLSVEFHDFIDAASLPRIRQAIARLEELGFCVLRFSLFTYGDVLFLNRRYVQLGALKKAWWIFRYKIWRGVARRTRRTFNREGEPPPGYAFLR